MHKMGNTQLEIRIYLLENLVLLNSFDEIYISHILREGNAMIDYLANIACDGQDMMSLAPTVFIIQDTKLKDLVFVDMIASSSK